MQISQNPCQSSSKSHAEHFRTRLDLMHARCWRRNSCQLCGKTPRVHQRRASSKAQRQEVWVYTCIRSDLNIALFQSRAQTNTQRVPYNERRNNIGGGGRGVCALCCNCTYICICLPRRAPAQRTCVIGHRWINAKSGAHTQRESERSLSIYFTAKLREGETSVAEAVTCESLFSTFAAAAWHSMRVAREKSGNAKRRQKSAAKNVFLWMSNEENKFDELYRCSQGQMVTKGMFKR